jgi:TRAP-type transport system periplasmic protein
MKGKLRMTLGLVLTAILVCTYVPAASAASSPTIKLTFAAYHAASTAEAQLCKSFIDEVQAKTKGAVEIQFFPGGSLLAAGGMYDGVSTGVADIGAGDFSYTTGKFPETELALGPLGVTSPYSFTHAINDFYTKYHPKELGATHMLWLWGNGPSVLMSTTPIATLDELKGKRIRATGENGRIIKALGGSPETLPMSEVFDALSKGVLVGVQVDPSVLVSFKLGDVVKSITDVSKAVGNGFIFYVVMNKKAWDRLPPHIQTVFNQVASAWVDKAALAINQEDIDGIQYAAKAGARFITLSNAQTAKWKAFVQPLVQNYIKGLASKGFSAHEQTAHLEYLEHRLAHWAEQQVKHNIPLPLQVTK